MTIIYVLDLWLLTILIGPPINGILNYIAPNMVDPVLYYFMAVALAFSFIFSIPTLLLIVVTYRVLLYYELGMWYEKIIILMLTISGVISTSVLLVPEYQPTIVLTYSIAALISAMLIEMTDRIKNKLRRHSLMVTFWVLKK